MDWLISRIGIADKFLKPKICVPGAPVTIYNGFSGCNISWVRDHSWVSYALEHPKTLRSPDYTCKFCAPIELLPTV